MRSNPESLTAKGGLDFRGSSKNIANQRFAVFRDQLSYLAKNLSVIFYTGSKDNNLFQKSPL